MTQFWNFGTPPNISGTVEVRNLKFGMETEFGSSNGQKCKIASIGVMWGSRDPILEFCDPPNISGTVEARNFKIGTETEGGVF